MNQSMKNASISSIVSLPLSPFRVWKNLLLLALTLLALSSDKVCRKSRSLGRKHGKAMRQVS